MTVSIIFILRMDAFIIFNVMNDESVVVSSLSIQADGWEH